MRRLTIFDEARLALANIADFAGSLSAPSLRLGVTGLARAGKTVFITALVHNLIHGGRLPMFGPWRQRRITGASLKPQPDDAVPTFDYRAHVRTLVDERLWPDSTRSISEMRLTIAYESARLLKRNLGPGVLHLDIVDYPGEWLLDLPLLTKDYRAFSREAVAASRSTDRIDYAASWHEHLATLKPNDPEDDATVAEAAHRFTGYLRACRDAPNAVSTLPPGRFLMPGDLEGSPALTFAPLELPAAGSARPGSLWAMMERRYEAYRHLVVQPFFRDHFARLDRQVVLVDMLPALNTGATALQELESALAEILSAFRPGRSSWLASILQRRIDRILFAATKADHLHQTSHDRLEALMRQMLARAIARASFSGASTQVRAIAAVRATKEGTVMHGGEALPCILGTPLAGETLDGRTYDGSEEIALFPGDLPQDAAAQFGGASDEAAATAAAPVGLDLNFLRFRPPALERTAEGLTLSLPHIRLDRALDFLIGDALA